MSFSTEPDMTRLVDAGLVGKDWNSDPEQGPRHDLRRLLHRPQGQPEAHQDLGRPAQAGRRRSSPRTRSRRAPPSGTCSPAYGAKSDGGKNPEAGLDYLTELITKHVKVQDKSGREALQTFTSGTGDVLLSYEYEATTARKKGEERRLRHRRTTRSRSTSTSPSRRRPRPQAQKFLDYVLSKPGQERFADWGYRPVNQEVFDANKSKFPEPSASSPSMTSAAGRR